MISVYVDTGAWDSKRFEESTGVLYLFDRKGFHVHVPDAHAMSISRAAGKFKRQGPREFVQQVVC